MRQVHKYSSGRYIGWSAAGAQGILVAGTQGILVARTEGVRQVQREYGRYRGRSVAGTEDGVLQVF